MTTPMMLLAAVIGGWIIQAYLTYQQAMAFNAQVAQLRKSGRVSTGVAGRRYRGGRAYVSIAVDDSGIVRDALTLSGWTTFARGRPLRALIGQKISVLKGDREIVGLTKQQREAAQQAAELVKREGSPTTTDA